MPPAMRVLHGLSILTGVFLLTTFYIGGNLLWESPWFFYSVPLIGLLLLTWSVLSLLGNKLDVGKIGIGIVAFFVLGFALLFYSLWGL